MSEEQPTLDGLEGAAPSASVPTLRRDLVQRRVHFYALGAHGKGSVIEQAPEMNWADLVEQERKKSALLQVLDKGAAYDVNLLERGCVLLGQRVPEGSVQQYDRFQGFRPVQNESLDTYLARVNFGVFLPFNVCGIIGAKGAPGIPAMTALANQLRPLTPKRWFHSALLSDPEIERFEKLQGAKGFEYSATILTGKGLPGLEGYGRDTGEYVDLPEGQVRLSVKVDIDDKSAGPAMTRALKSLAAKILRRGTEKMVVTPRDEEFSDELISLFSHQTSYSVEVPRVADPDQIASALAEIVSEHSDRLREIAASR